MATKKKTGGQTLTGIDEIIRYAYGQQSAFSKAVANMNGYETMTTFWADLTIADVFGAEAVQETYDRINLQWRQNFKYYTEFVLCLNHKIWYYYEKDDILARLYNKLWQEADTWARDNFKGEAAQWYFDVTD